eukprot:5111984-Amphidinium_carterae.2
MQGASGQLGQHRAKIVVALAVDEPGVAPKMLIGPKPASTPATSAGQPAGSMADTDRAGEEAPRQFQGLLLLRRDHPTSRAITCISHGRRSDR